MEENKYTVLVIDDDVNLLKFVTKVLMDKGYVTLTAEDGMKALDIYQKVTIHLVITDIYMREINGFDLIQRLKELKSTVKILAISGDIRQHENHSLDWAKAAGAAAVMEKPLDPETLVATVKKLIGH